MANETWPPKPGPEHTRLTASAGTWDVDCTYFMSPDQPPLRVKARETVEKLGGFWIVSRFQSNMMGTPFMGQAIVGYDPARAQWVASWIDSMMPYYFFFHGAYDGAGKVLTMRGVGGDPQSGQMIKYRTTEETLADGRRRFEMFREAPEGDVKLFTYVYTRAKAAAKPAARTAKSGGAKAGGAKAGGAKRAKSASKSRGGSAAKPARKAAKPAKAAKKGARRVSKPKAGRGRKK